MKPPFVALALVTASLLAVSCSSKPERVPHPTVAMLHLEPSKGGKDHEMIVKAVNGQRVADQRIRGGMVLGAGWNKITLSAKGHGAEAMGARLGGDTGSEMGARIDANASSHFDRMLEANLQVDHDYLARMKKHKDHYDFEIKDEVTKRVVARSVD